MSKYEEASLILKIYELRREDTMRKARDWYFLEFNPESISDIAAAMFSERSGHLRMVWTYWDMAAALVNHGAIGLDFFKDTNTEYIGVFAKVQPFLTEARAMFGPQLLVSLERLIDTLPDGRTATDIARERMKGMRAHITAARAKATTSNH